MTADSLNANLVAFLKQNGLIKRAEVERAFLATPRHLFVPSVGVEEAYQDRAIATKMHHMIPISSISQPAIIAIMLEQLDARAGMNVLEIGAGTGYNAALLSQLVGNSGRVTTIDIDDDIVQGAREHLQAAGVSNVRVLCADGGLGDADGAPYDRIVLTVGAWDISPAWLAQLKTGGVLLLPLWIGARQYAIAFEKVDEHLRSCSLQLCGFMALRGNFAGPPVWQSVGDYLIGGEHVERVNGDKLRALLETQPDERTLAVGSEAVPLNDLLDYLAAHGDITFFISSENPESRVKFGYTLCDEVTDSVAVFVAKGWQDCEPSYPILLYGSPEAWNILELRAQSFIADGQPSLARGIFEAYPIGHAPADARVMRRRWMEYVWGR